MVIPILSADFRLSEPKSFNFSYVPLSVWQIHQDHTLGIFEAGISKMEKCSSWLKLYSQQLVS
ncbi:hypothetical protein CS542_08705 [Pedobacter sp. IW39]|nr:hypothetical protein CS542_08705 [Pedobacter sp. IW39]